MTYEFHPLARLEFAEATEFYESRRAGLGASFSHEIIATIERIAEAPDRWRVIIPGIRRCFAHAFPYAIIYRERDKRLLVLAVAHTSRRPGYWSERLA